MTINNFICPCCGLPNHLEITKKNQYDYLKLNGVAAQSDFTGKYRKFLVDEENLTEVHQELLKRFEQINNLTLGNFGTYNDWFLKNVVCFVNEKEHE